LGNRLRAIGSAVALAGITGRWLTVNWYQTKDLNSAFRDLFETDGLPFNLLEHDARGLREVIPKSIWRLREHALGMLSRPILSPIEAEALAGKVDELKAISSRKGTFFIRTYSRLIDDPEVFSYFRPARELQRIIDDYLPRLRRAVGVHIRRTDNHLSVGRSPTSRFIELMQIERERDPGTQFFLATDSPDEVRRITSEFGAAVFEHAKVSLNRNSPQAIRDAVVDLYCLASCRKLLGSYGSTFSDAAGEIYQIDRVIVEEGA